MPDRAVVTLTTLATDQRAIPPGNGTAFVEVECWCGVWTSATEPVKPEEVLRCRRCNNIIAVLTQQEATHA